MGSEARLSTNGDVRAKIYVIGMGMGNPDTLTLAARSALERSELVIGAPRLIEALDGLEARKLCHYHAAEIERELRAWVASIAAEVSASEESAAKPYGQDGSSEVSVRVASVVMSGDVGFYSGATGLLERIADLPVEAIAGISSLAYFCAKLATTWQDAHVVSAHGRAHNVVGAVQSHAKTFVLTDARSSPDALCAQLVERGLADVQVSVGERLSYADERITTATAGELARASFVQPAVMLVLSRHPLEGTIGAPYLADEAFCRGKVPMTKEEVRELALCKLRVRVDDVVWDVGAGTGSVSVECARAAREGQVLAVERNEEALVLLRRNKEAFGLDNLRIVAGEAPEALGALPAPDRVFVGGSGGQLASIVRVALAANPDVRVCIAAITLETLAQAVKLVSELGLRDADIVQLSVAKARVVGSYHMMRAANPVYLVCADGSGTCASTDASEAVRDLAADETDGRGRG